MKKALFTVFTVLMFMGTITLGCLSCKTTNDEPQIVKETSYEVFFDYDYVDTVYYDSIDETYIMRYNDPDVFDYEELADRCGLERWYGDYVDITIPENTLPDFMYDYMLHQECDDYDEAIALSMKYSIVESEYTFSDSTKSVNFRIIFYEDSVEEQ